MSRKTKTGLDYFPHDCIFDDNLEYIIALHHELGYYVFFRLLEKIYFENGYYFLANEKNLILFSSKIIVNIEEINVIINDCLSEHLFDESLHKEHQILTSKGIQDRYFEAIKRRKEVTIINDYILINNVDTILQNADIIKLNADKSTQSKVEKSKVEKSKVGNSITTAIEILNILKSISNEKLNEMKELTLFNGDILELSKKFAVEFIGRYGLNKTKPEVLECFQSWMHKDKNIIKSKEEEVTINMSEVGNGKLTIR